MATYLDGMEGGKHNSDSTESISKAKTFEVTLKFTDISAKNPLLAAKKIASWLRDDSFDVVYDILDETTKETFTVDLGENDEDAVLPNKNK